MSKHTLSGGEENVRGDKAADLGVVVPRLQIVPLRLCIVNVASVAEWVQHSQRARQRSRAVQLLAPGVVSVFGDSIPVIVNELDYIPLPVADVVVIRPVEVDGGDFSSLVVEEQQDVVSCGQSHQHRTVVMVIRRSGACGLLCPQPVLVVSVGVRSRLVGQDRVVVAGKVQSPPGESSERIVCICHYLTICKGDRQGAIVSVVGIDRVPALPGDRTDQFCQVVVHVVFVTVGGDGTSVRDIASRTRERLLRHGHASSRMVISVFKVPGNRSDKVPLLTSSVERPVFLQNRKIIHKIYIMNEDDIKYRLLIKNPIKIPFARWTDRKEKKERGLLRATKKRALFQALFERFYF